MTEPLRQFATYRHYRGGVYVKLCEAEHTETGEILVIYTCAVSGAVFCRPKAMFEESITTEEYTGPRFTPFPQTTTKAIRKSLKYDPPQT
jgi:hypothetical protein